MRKLPAGTCCCSRTGPNPLWSRHFPDLREQNSAGLGWSLRLHRQEPRSATLHINTLVRQGRPDSCLDDVMKESSKQQSFITCEVDILRIPTEGHQDFPGYAKGFKTNDVSRDLRLAAWPIDIHRQARIRYSCLFISGTSKVAVTAEAESGRHCRPLS